MEPAYTVHPDSQVYQMSELSNADNTHTGCTQRLKCHTHETQSIYLTIVPNSFQSLILLLNILYKKINNENNQLSQKINK